MHNNSQKLAEFYKSQPNYSHNFIEELLECENIFEFDLNKYK